MKIRVFFAALLLSAGMRSSAQIAGDTIGIHDLSSQSGAPVSGLLGGSCLYCHAPHSGIGGQTPLWNQKLSQQVYTPYSSTTAPEVGRSQPPLSSPTRLCLSCHDGTVAPGQTQAYGTISVAGKMNPTDQFSQNLQSSHPFSLVTPLVDAPYLVATLSTKSQTADPAGAVKLINGNVECTSCHDPHIQSIDKVSQNFLVRDASNGQLCLACHDPNRVVTGQVNPLAQWSTSVHAIATNGVTPQAGKTLGSYPSVAANACISCHAPHNAAGPARLLRGANEQDCIACHGGGSNLSPSILNIFAEYSKVGHPLPSGTNQHDAGEGVLLNQDRHATCVDCHNSHASSPTLTFNAAPALRPSQNLVAGISGSDGVTALQAAANQFENCFRCHANSIGKGTNAIYGYLPVRTVAAGDPLDLVPQFALSSTSSHPVTHDSSSTLPQPSLLPAMMRLDGVTQGRGMGTRIFCTDCHNSDDNRESGGPGPNGPHGSKFNHILERRYEISQAPAPGQPILNLYPSPDLSAAGPYALCGKCHSLSQVMANTSFTQHSRHLNDGFSCSACHTAHGMGATSPSVSGERLVNFDANVVAPNGSAPISYNRAANSCNLVCHGYAHAGAANATPPAKTGAARTRH